MSRPTLLIVIFADPAKSGAPAEALRMGMGLATGNRTVQLVLMGPAARILTEDVDDLVDGEMMENHLEVFEEWGTPFHVDAAAITRYHIASTPVPVVPVAAESLAPLMARANQVMVFA